MSARAVGVSAALATLVGVVVLLGGGLAGGDSGSGSTPPLVGERAPELAGETLGGGRYTLDPSRAGVTVVNVWASWCAPCRDELPLLAGSAARWPKGTAQLVTVNTQDGPDAARSLLDRLGLAGLPTVLDPDGDIAVAWGTWGVPETFVLDRDGIIRARQRGEVTEEWLQAQVDRWAAP